MKKLIIFLMLASTPCFAGGGSSIGPSACSKARYTCSSIDEQTVTCLFVDNKALVALRLANGGTYTQFVDIESVAHVGAISKYSGNGYELTVTHGFEMPNERLRAYLTYGSAGYTNYPVTCSANQISPAQ